MFSLFKKCEEEIVAIFDIGNGSVGGALVKLEKHGRPVILYSYREPITFIPHPSSKHLLNSMLKLLKSVAHHLAKDGLAHIKLSPFSFHRLKDAYCVFASPWYISQTKIIREEWPEQSAITEEVLNALVQKEQLEFNRSLKEGKYEHIFGSDTRVLEKRIINVRLNGYTIEEPVGKSARQLELTLFSSFMSHDILSKVEETIHGVLAVRSIHHYSYGLVSWGAAQTLFPDVHDYFFIDVTGETTDVSLIVKDVLIETISFPMGRSTLIRKLVKDFSIAPDIALSFLVMLSADKLDAAFKAKLETVLHAVEVDWYDGLVVALQKFQKIYSLPRATFITADLDTSTFFLEALSRECPTELNVAKGTLAVTYIGAHTIQQHVELLPTVALDSFLAIESAFLNRLFLRTHNNL